MHLFVNNQVDYLEKDMKYSNPNEKIIKQIEREIISETRKGEEFSHFNNANKLLSRLALDIKYGAGID